MASPVQDMPALDSTLGAIQIGIIVSICLYGAMCVQAFTYYQAGFEKEHMHVQVLVIWCIVVETVHTVFITVYLYQATVKHFGDYSYIPVAPWPLSFSVATSTFVSAPVQAIISYYKIFFAARIYVISKNWYLFALSSIASMMRMALSIATSTLADKSPTLAIFEQKYLYLVAWAIAIGGVIDVTNSVALCYYLLRGKSEIRRSRMIIDKLVTWTIETGLLTSILGVALLLGMKHNTIWLCPIMFSAKLYSNSFFATLNGRLSLRRAELITMSSFLPSHSCTGQIGVETTQETLASQSLHDSGLSRITKVETVPVVPESSVHNFLTRN